MLETIQSEVYMLVVSNHNHMKSKQIRSLSNSISLSIQTQPLASALSKIKPCLYLKSIYSVFLVNHYKLQVYF